MFSEKAFPAIEHVNDFVREVGGAGPSDGQHVEGEGLPAEGVAARGEDGGNAEAEVVA